MAKLERIYTIPLGKAYDAVRNKRVPRAVKIIRTFMARHMKADGERILLSTALNAYLWERSIQKPPRRVKVRLVKDDGAIRAYLPDEKPEEPKKKEEKKGEDKKAEAKDKKPEAKKEEKKPEAPKAEPAKKETR
ncbi:50S ribosomal protein L31e [Candidatus Micrarchaeota archaeon]|nr:50S ribosomal protein L31e [Candidatus Micrarchaeota archaeon]